MRQPIKSSALKRLIIVLAVLLALSLTALCIVLVQRRSAPTAELSGNRITAQTMAYTQAVPQRTAVKTLSSQYPTQSFGRDVGIELYKRQDEYNVPFTWDENKSETYLWPGDSITKPYCVRVYHNGTITVHFRADVTEDQQKLGEVLRIKVESCINNSGAWNELYDGLMKDMPTSVDTQLPNGSDYVDYQITVSLDTSVDSLYADKELKANFRWWVEGSSGSGGNGGGGQLIDGPKTGDTFQPLLWGALSVGAVIGLVVVLRRRKEGRA